eukprot:7199944-Karenia_brevis.AAC.1
MAALRESEAFKLTQHKHERNITTTPPIYLNIGRGTPFKFKINHSFYNYHYRKATPTTQGFLNLLKTSKVAPATREQPGLTWLELLLVSLAAAT